MAKMALRLYGNQGCPHCMAALAFLEASKVPVQSISVEGDPIITAGLDKIYGSSAGVPVLVSFDTKNVITGFKVDEYERMVKDFHAEPSPSTNGAVPIESVNPEPPAPVVEQPAPVVEGTA